MHHVIPRKRTFSTIDLDFIESTNTKNIKVLSEIKNKTSLRPRKHEEVTSDATLATFA